MAANTSHPVAASKLGRTLFPVGMRATGKKGMPAFLVMRDGPSSGQSGQLLLKVFGSLAAISAFFYGLGYLISVSYFRMLGVDLLPGMAVEITNEHVVYRGIMFPVFSLTCVAVSASNWRSLILMAVLLMLWMPHVIQAAWRRWRTRVFWLERWHRLFARAQALRLGAAALVLLGITFAAQYGAMMILQQNQLLLPETSAAGDGGATRSLLLGAELDMRTLHREENEIQRRALYGLFFVAAVFCMTVWLRLWQAVRRRPHACVQLARKPVMGVIGLFVVMQVFLVPFLYGYLVPEPRFPRIQVAGNPLLQHGGENDSDPIELLLLGTRGTTAFLYNTQSGDVWWANTEDLLPAKGLGQVNPFHQKTASDANNGCRNADGDGESESPGG